MILTVNTTFFDKNASEKNWAFLRFLVRESNFSRHNLSMQRSIKHLKTKGYTMLKNYKNWLIQKGYSTTTQNNKPSTVYDYMTSLVRVCHWESKMVEQLAESISTILPQYTIGEHSARGRMKSRAVRCSIRAFSKFLIETQVA